MTEIVNIDEENFNILQTTWEISMKLSGKIKFYDNIKSRQKPGFTLSLENAVCETPQGERQIDPSAF